VKIRKGSFSPDPPVQVLESFRVGVDHSSLVSADRFDVSNTLARQVSSMGDFRDEEFALNISVKRAIKEHGVIAEEAIRAELQQMVDKQVWTLVKLDQIPPNKRGKIIRPKMFCKAKFNADVTFDKFKARLVAGGDMQVKTDYDDLSAPTVPPHHCLPLLPLQLLRVVMLWP
jgi:hypothetical protein